MNCDRSIGPVFIGLLLLAGCKGRTPLSSAWSDASGHRLYLFEDSVYIAYAGEMNERLIRAPHLAFGSWRSAGDSLVLDNDLPTSVEVIVTPDTPRTAEFMVHLQDRWHTSISGEAYRNIQLIDEEGRSLYRSMSCPCFFSDHWHPWLVLVDSNGVIPSDTLRFTDPTNGRYRAVLNWPFMQTFPTVMRLHDYLLVRHKDQLMPDRRPRVWSGQDPMFLEMDPFVLAKREKRSMEEMAYRIKTCGNPEVVRCRRR